MGILVDQQEQPLTLEQLFLLIHSALGCGVTFTWASGRVPCSMTTNTYSSQNVAVTATKKSHATIAFAWFF
jgi:hypothetical protein